MKKGLSVLLIAAALFGFYGGATNLNDVLACKGYWEVKGEESTADMNKLEDGLNQLKENEQAYLDGVDALDEGEQALADGEVALAEGQKTLAKGEADYAAAPAKLRKGKKDLSNITKLINGLNKAKKSFNDYSVNDDGDKGPSWKQGFEHKVGSSVLQKIAAGEKTSDSPGLKQAREVITDTVKAKKGMLNAAGALGGAEGLADNILGANTYAQFDKAVAGGVKPLLAAASKLEGLSAKASGAVSANAKAFAKAKAALADDGSTLGLLKNLQGGLNMLTSDPYNLPESMKISDIPDVNEQVKALKAGIKANDLGSTIGEAKDNVAAGIELYSDPKGTVSAGINAALAQLGGAGSLSMVESLDADLYKSLTQDLGVLTQKVTVDNKTFSSYIDKFASDMTTLANKLTEAAKTARATSATFQSWDDGYQQLKDGQDQLADQDEGIPYAFQQMRSNSTLRKALKKNVPGTYAKLSKFTGSRLADDDMDKFDSDMKEITSMLKKILPVLKKVRSDGRKTYNQGLRDYKAAPAKLAAGRAQLAEGLRTLIDGRQQLADGKEKLAEYEDGEQQVRDGLATLMGTKPDGGLASILERRNGDDDFDNGDKHLDLDEGLEAVDVGRGYQADSGELITKELTNRAVGTAAGLGAGALAILAALLSFLKKNKGAGVCALLSAAAGAVGVAIGTSAGMEFSNIAGSVVGSMPWVACGVLAAVALVHAIVHFSGNKAA